MAFFLGIRHQRRLFLKVVTTKIFRGNIHKTISLIMRSLLGLVPSLKAETRLPSTSCGIVD